MPYINSSEHQKFISLCNSLIADDLKNGNLQIEDEGKGQLKSDLKKLQELAEKYRNTFSQLPKLSMEYNNLLRNIRINMRKMQLRRKTNLKNKSNGN